MEFFYGWEVVGGFGDDDGSGIHCASSSFIFGCGAVDEFGDDDVSGIHRASLGFTGGWRTGEVTSA